MKISFLRIFIAHLHSITSQFHQSINHLINQDSNDQYLRNHSSIFALVLDK